MTENNKKQAYHAVQGRGVPQSTREPRRGLPWKRMGNMIICMPGPPREMTRMFQRACFRILQRMSEGVDVLSQIRTFGIGESMLETKLLDLIDDQTDPTLATYAKEGECSLRIASKRKTEEEAKQAVDEMLEKVKERDRRIISIAVTMRSWCR